MPNTGDFLSVLGEREREIHTHVVRSRDQSPAKFVFTFFCWFLGRKKFANAEHGQICQKFIYGINFKIDGGSGWSAIFDCSKSIKENLFFMIENVFWTCKVKKSLFQNLQVWKEIDVYDSFLSMIKNRYSFDFEIHPIENNSILL